MASVLEIKDFLDCAKQRPLIDVRSPGEFAKGHIPDAINIPMLSDEERAEVGTLYKQQGRGQAIQKGLELVGPKIADFVKSVGELSREKKVLLYCWRGGMRSNSFAWLLNTSGIHAQTLHKGYKAFRKHVLDVFARPMDIVVLGGETGSGKTDILKAIAAEGEQVIDLEGLANHKGSAFGALGQKEQPTVEEFENFLAEKLMELDCSRRIWVEDESKSIGRIFIPQEFWYQMKSAPLIRVGVAKSERVKRLLNEYGRFSKSELETAVLRIQKRLGGLATSECLDALNTGNLELVANITLSYYDTAYNYNHEKRISKENIFRISLEKDDPVSAAQKVIQFANVQTTVNDYN